MENLECLYVSSNASSHRSNQQQHSLRIDFRMSSGTVSSLVSIATQNAGDTIATAVNSWEAVGFSQRPFVNLS